MCNRPFYYNLCLYRCIVYALIHHIKNSVTQTLRRENRLFTSFFTQRPEKMDLVLLKSLVLYVTNLLTVNIMCLKFIATQLIHEMISTINNCISYRIHEIVSNLRLRYYLYV